MLDLGQQLPRGESWIDIELAIKEFSIDTFCGV